MDRYDYIHWEIDEDCDEVVDEDGCRAEQGRAAKETRIDGFIGLVLI